MTRALLAATLLCAAACGDDDSLASTDLSVTFDDVFVADGGGPVPAEGAGDDEALLDVAGEPLGGHGNGRDDCKLLPIYWLPTSLGETASTTNRSATVCARMPRVRVGGWKYADASFEVFATSIDGYRVRVEADGLVPSSVYSAWLVYRADGEAYAVAPLGGPPNLLLPGNDGSATLERHVPARLLRRGSLLSNALPIDGDGDGEVRIRSGEIQIVLYYHSDAQSNGNATPGAPSPARGRVGVPGRLGLGAHAHLVGSIEPLR